MEEVASQVDFIFCAVNMPKDEKMCIRDRDKRLDAVLGQLDDLKLQLKESPVSYTHLAFYLDVQEGHLLCADCAAKAGKTCNLDQGALYALRHTICGIKPHSLMEMCIRDRH